MRETWSALKSSGRTEQKKNKRMASKISGVSAPAVALYEEIKAELEAMEYNEFLGLESMDLVRKLVNDLVLTTESHESQQERIERLEVELKGAQDRAFEMKKENARLVKENNKLHLDIIESKETVDEKERVLTAQVRTANDRVAEANFVTAQWKRRLEQAEKNLDALRRGVGSDQFANPQLDLTSRTTEADSVLHGKAKLSAEKSAIEMLESRISALNQQVNEIQAKLENETKKVELRDEEISRLGQALEQQDFTYKSKQHKNKTEEVSGSNGAVHRRPNGSGDRIAAQLYEQIDFLNSQLMDQERKLSKAKVDSKTVESLREELASKDKELKRALLKLSGVQQPNPALDDKENANPVKRGSSQSITTSVEENKQLLDEAKSGELAALIEAYSEDKARFSSVIQDLERQLFSSRSAHQQVEQEFQEKIAECEQLKEIVDQMRRTEKNLQQDLDDAQNALSKLHREQISSEESYSAISGEIVQLEKVIEDQNAELDFFRNSLDESRADIKSLNSLVNSLRAEKDEAEAHAVENQDHARHAKSALDSIMQERDALQVRLDSLLVDWKQVKLTLQETKTELQETVAKQERTEGRCRMLEEEIRTLTAQLVSKSEQYHKEAGARAELERLSDLPGTLAELEQQLERWRQRAADLDTESKRVARELEHAITQTDELREERDRMDAAMVLMRDKQDSANTQVRKVTLENEELKTQIKSLVEERDYASDLAHKTGSQAADRKAEVVSLQSELEQLRNQVETLHSEVDVSRRREQSLNERLETLRDCEARLEDAENKNREQTTRASSEAAALRRQIKSLEQEVALAQQDIVAKQEKASALEKKVQENSQLLQKEREENSNLVAHLEQFKSVFSKLDETRGSLQSRVKELYSALQKEKTKCDDLQGEKDSLEETTRVASEKIAHLERSVRDLHDQRNKLRVQLESNSKSSAQLETAVNQQEVSYRELEQRLGVAKNQLHTQAQALDARDNQISQLNDDLIAARKNIGQLEDLCRARNTELLAASDDLGNMTRENQTINASYQTVRVERDQIRSQLSEALARASRMEGLLESNKLEKADLLNVYRRACDETARLKRLVQELSTSRARAVGENQAQQVDSSRLRQRLAESEELCHRQQVDLQAFERQVSELSRQLNTFQTRLERNEEEKSLAERTASTARETTHQFVQREESLKWEIAQNQAEMERLSAKIARLQGENEALSANLLREKRRFQDLELVVEKARRAQARAEQAERAKEETIRALKTKMVDEELDHEQSFSRNSGHSGRAGSFSSSGGAVSSSIGNKQPPADNDDNELHHQQLNEVHSGTVDDSFQNDFIPPFPGNTFDQHSSNQFFSASPHMHTPPGSPDVQASPAPSKSGSSSGSSDVDHISTELEALISDQSEIIRRMNRDRQTFGTLAAQAREDLETSSSLLRARSPSPPTFEHAESPNSDRDV